LRDPDRLEDPLLDEELDERLLLELLPLLLVVELRGVDRTAGVEPELRDGVYDRPPELRVEEGVRTVDPVDGVVLDGDPDRVPTVPLRPVVPELEEGRVTVVRTPVSVLRPVGVRIEVVPPAAEVAAAPPMRETLRGSSLLPERSSRVDRRVGVKTLPVSAITVLGVKTRGVPGFT
jgi:hypothetical protein